MSIVLTHQDGSPFEECERCGEEVVTWNFNSPVGMWWHTKADGETCVDDGA